MFNTWMITTFGFILITCILKVSALTPVDNLNDFLKVYGSGLPDVQNQRVVDGQNRGRRSTVVVYAREDVNVFINSFGNSANAIFIVRTEPGLLECIARHQKESYVKSDCHGLKYTNKYLYMNATPTQESCQCESTTTVKPTTETTTAITAEFSKPIKNEKDTTKPTEITTEPTTDITTKFSKPSPNKKHTIKPDETTTEVTTESTTVLYTEFSTPITNEKDTTKHKGITTEITTEVSKPVINEKYPIKPDETTTEVTTESTTVLHTEFSEPITNEKLTTKHKGITTETTTEPTTEFFEPITNEKLTTKHKGITTEITTEFSKPVINEKNTIKPEKPTCSVTKSCSLEYYYMKSYMKMYQELISRMMILFPNITIQPSFYIQYIQRLSREYFRNIFQIFLPIGLMNWNTFRPNYYSPLLQLLNNFHYKYYMSSRQISLFLFGNLKPYEWNIWNTLNPNLLQYFTAIYTNAMFKLLSNSLYLELPNSSQTQWPKANVTSILKPNTITYQILYDTYYRLMNAYYYQLYYRNWPYYLMNPNAETSKIYRYPNYYNLLVSLMNSMYLKYLYSYYQTVKFFSTVRMGQKPTEEYQVYIKPPKKVIIVDHQQIISRHMYSN